MAAEPITVTYQSGTPKVAVRRDGDGKYLDFNDLTFKAVGWTTLDGTLAADGVKPKLFRTTLDPTAWGAGLYQFLFVDSVSGAIVASLEKNVVVVNGVGTFSVLDAFEATALARLGSGQVATTAPVTSAGTLTLVQGDDYYNVDARALEWTSTTWPDLTNAVIKLGVDVGVLVYLADGAVITALGPGKVRVELSAAQTRSLAVGTHVYDLQATLTGGAAHVVTLARGSVVVSKEYAR